MKIIAALFGIALGSAFLTSAQANTVLPKTSQNLEQAIYWNTQAEEAYNLGKLKKAKRDLTIAVSFENNTLAVPFTEQKLAQLNKTLETLAKVEEGGAKAIVIGLLLIAFMIFLNAVKPHK